MATMSREGNGRGGVDGRRSRWGVALVAMLTLVACGEEQPGPMDPIDPSEPGARADVNTFTAALPAWQTFSPPVAESQDAEKGDPVTEAEPVTPADPRYNPNFVCTSREYSMAKNPREVITMSGALGLLVPGQLMQGRAHRDGSLLDLPIAQRAPVRLTISLNNVVGDAFREVANPSEGTLKTAVNQLIQAAETSEFEAGTSVSFEQATSYSFEQAALGLGLSVRYMGSSVKGSLEARTSAEKLTVTASFIQNAFTIGVETPQTAADWFSDDFTEERLQEQIAAGAMGPDNLPIYVSDVTYGRIIMITFTSTASEEDIKASLEATYNGGFWGGELDLTAERQNVLKSSELSIQQLGGPTEGAFKLANVLQQQDGSAQDGDFGLAEFFAEDVSLTTFVPISYTLRNLEGNTVAGVGETANYSVMECEPINETILSDFDTEGDEDGWGAINARSNSGNNPDPRQGYNNGQARVGAGYLYAGDGNSGTTYFLAPPKFLGDKSAYVGGRLSYWLRWSLPGSDNGAPFSSLTYPDVEITGVTSPLILVYSAGQDNWAEDTWVQRVVDFEPNPSLRVYTAGEGIGTAVEATAEQIAEVLADVAGLRLRGEYRAGGGGGDFGWIDHVLLEPGS